MFSCRTCAAAAASQISAQTQYEVARIQSCIYINEYIGIYNRMKTTRVNVLLAYTLLLEYTRIVCTHSRIWAYIQMTLLLLLLF